MDDEGAGGGGGIPDQYLMRVQVMETVRVKGTPEMLEMEEKLGTHSLLHIPCCALQTAASSVALTSGSLPAHFVQFALKISMNAWY